MHFDGRCTALAFSSLGREPPGRPRPSTRRDRTVVPTREIVPLAPYTIGLSSLNEFVHHVEPILHFLSDIFFMPRELEAHVSPHPPEA